MFTWVSSHLLQRVLAQLMDQTAEVWNNGSFPNKEIVNEVNQTRHQYTLCLLYKTLSCSWQTTEIKTWMMHWSNDELCLVYGNKEQRNNSNWIWIFKFKFNFKIPKAHWDFEHRWKKLGFHRILRLPEEHGLGRWIRYHSHQDLGNKHLGFKILQNVSARDNQPALCIFMMNVVSPPEDGQNIWHWRCWWTGTVY